MTKKDTDKSITQSTTKAVKAEIVSDKEFKKIQSAKQKDANYLVPADSLSSYLAKIREYPLLTKDQEREVAERYHENKNPKPQNPKTPEPQNPDSTFTHSGD